MEALVLEVMNILKFIMFSTVVEHGNFELKGMGDIFKNNICISFGHGLI